MHLGGLHKPQRLKRGSVTTAVANERLFRSSAPFNHTAQARDTPTAGCMVLSGTDLACSALAAALSAGVRSAGATRLTSGSNLE